MIDIIPTSDLGLDVLLGGGWRLITRLPGKASATVLVRGGAGSGKTLMGFQVALDLATELKGDIAVGCVEILPTEYMAQLLSARSDIDAKRIISLPGEAAEHQEPRIFCGLLTELNPESPDLVASLENLERDIKTQGGKPVVFIVDSLIEGYGIGSSVERVRADEVVKFAVAGGYGLVLCEETKDETQSPWVFAVDTVLALGIESRERGRWIEVRKHRFGPTASGRHELDIRSGEKPAVYPEIHAWLTRHVPEVLARRDWSVTKGPGQPRLAWHETLSQNITPNIGSFTGNFVVVVGSISEIILPIALGVLPADRSGRDVIVDFDTLLQREETREEGQLTTCYLPTLFGGAKALQALVGLLSKMFERKQPPKRVVINEFDSVGTFPWVDVVMIFASLMAYCARDVLVVACGLSSSRHALSASADLLINVEGGVGNNTITSLNGTVRPRRPVALQQITWRTNTPTALASVPGWSELSQRRRFVS